MVADLEVHQVDGAEKNVKEQEFELTVRSCHTMHETKSMALEVQRQGDAPSYVSVAWPSTSSLN
jgi:hypothetical protein